MQFHRLARVTFGGFNPGMTNMRFRLPGGTLKVKSAAYLRSAEWERKVPVWQFGSMFFIWWRGKTGIGHH